MSRNEVHDTLDSSLELLAKHGVWKADFHANGALAYVEFFPPMPSIVTAEPETDDTARPTSPQDAAAMALVGRSRNSPRQGAE
jgi:hypothetical protein